MIRLERDPAIWRVVADHPDVAPYIGPCDVEAWIESPLVTPLFALNGGWILIKTGGAGLVFEFHAMFTKAGRGREAFNAMTSALEHAFAAGARLVTVTEIAERPMSVPPRSAGFRACGPFCGPYRLWVLTHDAWFNSPACKRMERLCLNS